MIKIRVSTDLFSVNSHSLCHCTINIYLDSYAIMSQNPRQNADNVMDFTNKEFPLSTFFSPLLIATLRTKRV